MIGRPNIRHN